MGKFYKIVLEHANFYKSSMQIIDSIHQKLLSQFFYTLLFFTNGQK